MEVWGCSRHCAIFTWKLYPPEKPWARIWAGTGFLLNRNPDTVRAPDFAFIAKKNLPATDPQEAFWPGAPDLAVEVLSPGDTMGEVDEKIEEWLSAGCTAVWVIDAALQTVTVYQSTTNARLWIADETMKGDPVLPGFTCNVGYLFE